MPYFLGAVVVMWKFQWHVCGFLFTSPLAKLPLAVFYHQIKFNNFQLPLFLCIRGLLEKYPTFGREKETGLLGALDT
jgi:hypothetical protein